MKRVTLDLTGCKYVLQIHNKIKDTFCFPEFYGRNYSALWDCMRDYCDDMEVDIKGLYTLPSEFDEFRDKMLEIFNRVCEENDFKYSVIS